MSATITYGQNGCQHVTVAIEIDGETRKTTMMRDELFGTQTKDEAFKAELSAVCKTASAMAKGEIETPIVDDENSVVSMSTVSTVYSIGGVREISAAAGITGV